MRRKKRKRRIKLIEKEEYEAKLSENGKTILKRIHISAAAQI